MPVKYVGVVLVNLGTPEECNTEKVGVFLKEFLSDPFVVDLPTVVRWVLVNLFIVPRRAKQSAIAYQKIWMPSGSPLIIYTRELASKLQNKLGPDFLVKMAFRYGKPNIVDALTTFKQAELRDLIVLPLFPQYAAATTDSVINKFRKTYSHFRMSTPITFIPEFYNNQGYVNSFAIRGETRLRQFAPDHVLFSFHGLPLRHIKKLKLSKHHCMMPDYECCGVINEKNAKCYRAQCMETARLIAAKLYLRNGDFTIAFQSRLGVLPWIKPYTSEVIPRLASTGIRRLLVFCPSFVCDCVETLEEINIRGREAFFKAGGKAFELVPCLNSEDYWVDAVAGLVRNSISTQSRFQSVDLEHR